MIQIRPVSDLRNKFTEIESAVKEGESWKTLVSSKRWQRIRYTLLNKSPFCDNKVDIIILKVLC